VAQGWRSGAKLALGRSRGKAKPCLSVGDLTKAFQGKSAADRFLPRQLNPDLFTPLKAIQDRMMTLKLTDTTTLKAWHELFVFATSRADDSWLFRG
jgi:hypothetical protein